MPGTSKFPVNNLSDLANAKHEIARTTEPRAKVVAYLNRRARALGGTPVGGTTPDNAFAHGRPRTR